jgi:hypothetical protein
LLIARVAKQITPARLPLLDSRFARCDRGTLMRAAGADAASRGMHDQREVLAGPSRFLLVLALSTSLLTAAASAEPVYPAAAVKAEFIERFAQFVDWPASALPKDATFVVCVLGTSDITAPLRHIAKQRTFKHRRAIVRLPTPETASTCHVLFVTSEELPKRRELLAALRKYPVLTISELGDNRERGAIITLFVEDRKQRFEIDPDIARDSGLELRAKLLRLGRSPE